jgi:DNA repair protein RadC
VTTLYFRDGEHYRPANEKLILESAQRLIARRFRAGTPVLRRPERVREFIWLRLGALEHEMFAALFLDDSCRLIEYVELFRGTFDVNQIHAREVVKEALARNASAVILVHNHPSGISRPSEADLCVTRRLKVALATVDVRVLDHFIVGESIMSFADRGLI